MQRSHRQASYLFPAIFICLAVFSSHNPVSGGSRVPEATSTAPGPGDRPQKPFAEEVYHLPVVLNTATFYNPPGEGQLVNVPYFPDGIDPENNKFKETAVFWFGRVDLTNNYADVRVGYTPEELYVHVAIFDRLVWYDNVKTQAELGANEIAELDQWDAATLYLDLDGNQGSSPSTHAFRFTGQVRNVSNNPFDYQEAYQGTGSGWNTAGIPFTTDAFWRGAPNDETNDAGWRITYRIPFTSLPGLAGPPPKGSVWGLGVAVHDRDDAAGTPIDDQVWPTGLSPNQSSTWGRLSFGLPSYSPPAVDPSGELVIRQGLDGAVVQDGEVGGGTDCGSGMNKFTEWGDNTEYAHSKAINIQNQYDVSDFLCFSKVFITFELDDIPPGKVITSSTLTFFHFSNSGLEACTTDDSETDVCEESLIQVSTVGEDWDEDTLTWNNAPQALENVSQSWVPWLVQGVAPDGNPISWDLLRATVSAYETGEPLRLALYSADASRHSGKYFWSSEYDYKDGELRPNLTVTWGNP